VSSKADLVTAGAGYIEAAGTTGLHAILPINAVGKIDPIVINTLKKSELVKIYGASCKSRHPRGYGDPAL